MSDKKESVIHGIAASPGIAIGPALVIATHNAAYSEPEDITITPEKVESEILRFSGALDKTREELQNFQKRIQDKLQEREASIFDAHLLIVDDQMLLNEVEDLIRRKLKTAEFAFYKIIQRYVTAISVMPDKYIKDRAHDIQDVASRILANLHNRKRPMLDHIEGRKIIIAKELTPSDTALLDREHILGFAVETGSNTSHTAILARSMQIPAVVGIHGTFGVLSNDDTVILDGFIGTLIINPDEKTLDLYRNKAEQEERFYIDLIKESRLRPETVDGYMVQLSANLESLADIDAAQKFGTTGVGLFRTEYLYMTPGALPSEEQQFQTYCRLSDAMKDQPVVIRTLDIGGDKLEDSIYSISDPNPFLGIRAIRLCLKERRDLFRTQLRAILRAGSRCNNLKIMFPMISCMEEVIEIKEFMRHIQEELLSEKQDFNKDIEIGIMIETPAAAIIADVLAKTVDFFSIGTNDLVQYTSAIDRSNDKVAYLYKPSHPAILKLINRVVIAAKNNNIWVSVCGEMASDPRLTPLLVGLGVHELSMSPVSLGPVRRIIRRLTMHEAEVVAEEAMRCNTAEESLQLSIMMLEKISPEIKDLALKGL